MAFKIVQVPNMKFILLKPIYMQTNNCPDIIADSWVVAVAESWVKEILAYDPAWKKEQNKWLLFCKK